MVLLSWDSLSLPLDGKIVRSANNGGRIVALPNGKPSVENTDHGKKRKNGQQRMLTEKSLEGNALQERVFGTMVSQINCDKMYGQICQNHSPLYGWE